MAVADGCILVVDPQADLYAERLLAAVPNARLVWSRDFRQADTHLANARAVITMGIPAHGLHLNREVVAQMPRLEWVQCLLAGTEHLRGALSERPGLILTNVRGIHGPQMAETVLTHMLVLSRRVEHQLANQRARKWEPWAQPLLRGRSVGIVGLGASGTQVALACSSLGMTVYGVSRTDSEIEGVHQVFERSRLAEVAALVDFLVITVAPEPGTERLIDASVLRAMQPTAFLINISRGSVVDEPALIECLRAQQIAGAGLDVFATEPLPLGSPLWELENVYVTPHIGGRSDRYAEQALTVVEPNLRAFLGGSVAEMENVVTL